MLLSNLNYSYKIFNCLTDLSNLFKNRFAQEQIESITKLMEQSGILQRSSIASETNGLNESNNNAISLSSSNSSLMTNCGLSNQSGDRNSIPTSNGSQTDANLVDLDKMFAFLTNLQKSDSSLSLANSNQLSDKQAIQTQNNLSSSSTPSTTITTPSLITNEQLSPSICSLSSTSVSSSGFSSAMSSTTLTATNKENENENLNINKDLSAEFDKLIQVNEQKLNELDQINGNNQMLNRNANSLLNNQIINNKLNPNQCFKLSPANNKHANPSLFNNSKNSRPNSLASDCTLNSYSCSDQTSLESSLNGSSLPMFRLNQFNRNHQSLSCQSSTNNPLNNSANSSKPNSQCSNYSPEFNLKNSSTSSIYFNSLSFTNDQSSSSTTTLADLMQQSAKILKQQRSLLSDDIIDKTTSEDENKKEVEKQNTINNNLNNNVNNNNMDQAKGQTLAPPPPSLLNNLPVNNNLINNAQAQIPQPIINGQQTNMNGTLLTNIALQQQQQQQQQEYMMNVMSNGIAQQQQQHQMLLGLNQQNQLNQTNNQLDERRKQRVERKLQQLKEEKQHQPSIVQTSANGSVVTSDLLEFAEKYFNNHSRDQNNSSMIKTLTRRKKADNDNEAFSKTEMLTYTSNFSIPISHIRMQEQENSMLACTMFKELCKYMSQEMKQDSEHRIIQSILGKCIEREELRDELFVQLMRQITNNINREEVVRLWVLIGESSFSKWWTSLLIIYAFHNFCFQV